MPRLPRGRSPEWQLNASWLTPYHHHSSSATTPTRPRARIRQRASELQRPQATATSTRSSLRLKATTNNRDAAGTPAARTSTITRTCPTRARTMDFTRKMVKLGILNLSIIASLSESTSPTPGTVSSTASKWTSRTSTTSSAPSAPGSPAPLNNVQSRPTRTLSHRLAHQHHLPWPGFTMTMNQWNPSPSTSGWKGLCTNLKTAQHETMPKQQKLRRLVQNISSLCRNVRRPLPLDWTTRST